MSNYEPSLADENMIPAPVPRERVEGPLPVVPNRLYGKTNVGFPREVPHEELHPGLRGDHQADLRPGHQGDPGHHGDHRREQSRTCWSQARC